MSSSRGRAASYESDSEESSDGHHDRRRSLKSSVMAIKKSSSRRTPSSSEDDSSSSSSSSSDEDSDSDNDAPTPDFDKRRRSSDRNRQEKSRKRRHDSSSENSDKELPKKSKSTRAKDTGRSSQKERSRSDDYDRDEKRNHRDRRDRYVDYDHHDDDYDDYHGHNGRDYDRSDRESDRRRDRHRSRRDEEDDRQDYQKDVELERRRIEREKRHKEREKELDRRKHKEAGKQDEDDRSQKRAEVDQGRGKDKVPDDAVVDDKDFLAAKRAKNAGDEALTTRTGGAYIPPARLRMMQENIKDKASEQYQRIAWEALKKSLNGLINKVNISNMILIVRELFAENLVRGRGVLAKSIISAQTASPTFTNVYAALVAIINTKFPQIGELILKRLILQLKKGYRRNDKMLCLASVRFIAHLVNQQVAHEIIALEVLTLLLENPSDDSVEVTVGFLKECGSKLTEVSPRGINAIFERIRAVLHEGTITNRTQYMVEVMFAVRKDGFKDHPAVIEELDLVEEDDQFTHMLTLEDAVNSEDLLNVFKFDADYEENEEKYKVLKKEILDEGSSDDESGSGSGSGSSDGDSDGEDEEAKTTIIDNTETTMVAFRRTIYLTIQSSLDFEECAHKLLKTDIKPGMEEELCNMILDCCAQQRTYEKFFGLLAQRFCMIDKKYIVPCQNIFQSQYETCHRLETNKLRNVAKFFAHLLHTDAISWEVMQYIHLNEDETTSSSRIFIKILYQELSEYMGLPKLHDRLQDGTLAPFFEGLFPRDNPRNTRFAINFFTSIGLGGLTDELRAHLKTMPKSVPKPEPELEDSSSSSDSSSSDSSSSSSSSSDSDSSSSSSSSDSDSAQKQKRTKKLSKNKESSSPVKDTAHRNRRVPEMDRKQKEERRKQLQRECERLEELCLKARHRKKKHQQRESEDDEMPPNKKDTRRNREYREDNRDVEPPRTKRESNGDGEHRNHRDYDDSYVDDREIERRDKDRDRARKREYSDRERERDSRPVENGDRDSKDYRDHERTRDREDRGRGRDREERTRDRDRGRDHRR